MKREDIDAMEAKARAALAEMPEDIRSERWRLDVRGMCVMVQSPEDRWDIALRCDHELGRPGLEHIAASDPHAVLALIAELRRVERERDALADQRFLWLGRVLFPQLLDMPDDIILGRAPSGMSDVERAEMSNFRKRVEESPERIFQEVMKGERIPYNDAGTDLLQKAAKDGAPPTDGFVIDATERKPGDT